MASSSNMRAGRLFRIGRGAAAAVVAAGVAARRDEPGHTELPPVEQPVQVDEPGADARLHLPSGDGRSDHSSRSMQHGRVFLLGDAAHTISLAGGKGMNLAIADAEVLASALAEYYGKDDEQPLANDTADRRPKIWKAVLFSHWLINLLHSAPGHGTRTAFTDELRLATIDERRSRGPTARMFAEEYAGEWGLVRSPAG
ncbi:FAD-dependent monooxygenase [Micromonospora sp. NPDC048898]|uniref:FAD-dependent monooxygenase n=1 Tax=Micromonospora sp. NPDC048898 TaxID=3364260 RepID=UPI00371A3A88